MADSILQVAESMAAKRALTKGDKRWLTEMQKREHKHRLKMAVQDYVKNDRQVKWLFILAGSVAIDAVADTIQYLTEEAEKKGKDGVYALEPEDINLIDLYLKVGSMGTVDLDSLKNIFGGQTYDNPWQFMASIMESVGEGGKVLAVTMLILDAIFGGDDSPGGGLGQMLALATARGG